MSSFQVDITRYIRRPSFYIPFVVLLLLSVLTSWNTLVYLQYFKADLSIQAVSYFQYSNYSAYTLNSFVYRDPFNAANYLYFFLMPLFTLLPMGSCLLNDKKSGYYEQVLSRTTLKGYLSLRLRVNATLVCLLLGLPTLVNFLIIFSVFPAYPVYPSNELSVASVPYFRLLADLHYYHPLVYLGSMFVLMLLGGVLWSSLVMLVGLYFRNALRLIVGAFIVHIFVMNVFDAFFWTVPALPSIFMNPSNLRGSFVIYLVMVLLFTVLLFLIYFRVHKRDYE